MIIPQWITLCTHLREVAPGVFGVVTTSKGRNTATAPYFGQVLVRDGLVRKTQFTTQPVAGKTWSEVREMLPNHPHTFFFYPEGAPPPWEGGIPGVREGMLFADRIDWKDIFKWSAVITELTKVAGDRMLVMVLPEDTPEAEHSGFLTEVCEVILVGDKVLKSSPWGLERGSTWTAASEAAEAAQHGKTGAFYFYPLGAPAP